MIPSLLRPLLCIGTRPEAIKMAPVVLECRQRINVKPIICTTGQHKDLVRPILDYFGIVPEESLPSMAGETTLANLTANLLLGLDQLLVKVAPDCVVAQGDTASVLAASMAAFYRHVPFVHVEAGLRTGDLRAPWPEEFNRRVAGITAALHCAPTDRSAGNLRREGVPLGDIEVTGNTVVDALFRVLERERSRSPHWSRWFQLPPDAPVVLVTGHRRENFGEGLQNVCHALVQLSERFPDHYFLYPVHPNPKVDGPVRAILGNRPNVRLLAPAGYPEFVWLMNRATLILTDSGGIQEEAPSLGKRVLVFRDTTERPESVEAGYSVLVGTQSERIVEHAVRVLEGHSPPLDAINNPYGDGHAAAKIVDAMLARFARREISSEFMGKNRENHGQG
ncbi:MAG: UDP-N-acetylglucosamine 2-epimerase (non-hydrolyzing) [Planctomycetota bacterium]